LRDQLKEALPDIIDETPANPGIVTQLADISHVQEFAPSPPADVTISREALALRTRVGGGENTVQPALPSGERSAAVLIPTPEQEFSAPVAAAGRSGAASEPGTGVTAADDVSRVADAPISARGHLSHSISGGGVASSRPERAAQAADAAKSDEMVLVFVWVCKSRPR
jgi:hypothetical protein